MSGIFLVGIFLGLYALGNPFFSLFFVIIFSPLFYEFEFISYNGLKKDKILKILIFQLLLFFLFISKFYDFDKAELDNCIITFDRRVRNYGV